MPTLRASPAVESLLRALARRVRARRGVHAVGVTVFTLAAIFTLAWLADRFIGLTLLGFRAALAVLIAAGAGLALWSLWRLITPRLDAPVLASLCEKAHPELGERLVSAVGLEASDGSPFVAWVRSAAEDDVRRVEPRRAVPLERTLRFASLTALTLAGLAAALVSPSYSRFVARLFGAWAGHDVGYALQVEPGTTAVARGKPVTVRARLAVDDPTRRIPAACYLVASTPGGEQRQRMEDGGDGVFLYTWPRVDQGIEYRVEAGDARSDGHRVLAVDPVELAAAPSYVVTPPPYLDSSQRPAVEPGTGRVDFPQFSRVRAEFEFSRPPQQAWLVIRHPASKDEGTRVDVRLGDDSCQGSAEFLAASLGNSAVRLLTLAEHGVRSDLALADWSVHADTPPRFTAPARLLGVTASATQPAVVPPDEPLRVTAAVEDAEGLSAVEFTFQVNDGAVRTERWIEAKGERSVNIDQPLSLTPPLRDGDRLRFRLVATDNRQLKRGQLGGTTAPIPAEDLPPQVTHDPPAQGDRAGWVEVTVRSSAPSLAAAQIASEHDALRKAIDEARRKLRKEHGLLGNVRRSLHQQARLPAEAAKQTKEALALNTDAAADLLRAAAQVGPASDLAPLGDLLVGITETELAASEQALVRLPDAQRRPAEREADARSAEAAVLAALKKLDEIESLSTRLAQDRKDRLDLERLAARQQELARRVDDLLAKPGQEAALAEAKAEQDRIAQRMAQLRDQSRLLRQALAGVQAAQMKQLAGEARELAAQQREMAERSEKAVRDALAGPLAELAGKQADLARRLQAKAAEEKELTPPSLSPAQEAAASLREGDVDAARRRQEAAEARLKEWADEVQRRAAPSVPGRSLFEQLAKRQGDVKDALEQLGAEFSRMREEQVTNRLTDLVTQQRRLHEQIARHAADLGKDTKAPLLSTARDLAEQAAALLARRDALQSHQKMEEAQETLSQLARLFPDLAPTPASKADAEKAQAARKKVEQLEALRAEQAKLREEASRLLARAMKADRVDGKHGAARAEELMKELGRLTQQGGSPQMKQAAGEAMKALEAARHDVEKGDTPPSAATMRDAAGKTEDAALKLETAGKATAGDKDSPGAKGPPNDALAKALAETAGQMQAARSALDKEAGQAPQMMRQAAKALGAAARQLGQQARAGMPRSSPPSGTPGQSAGPAAPARPLPEAALSDKGAGRTWGELPGELKTRLLQDMRARYGDDYAPIIQRYFERIADVDARKSGENR